MPFIPSDEQSAANIQHSAPMRRPTITELAEQCLLDAESDKAEAARLLVERLETQFPQWWEAMKRDLITPWALGQIHCAVASNHRRVPPGTPKQSRLTPLDGASARSMAMTYTWYDFHVNDGVPLGDATRADLDIALKRYDARIAGATRIRSFLAAVHDRLKEDGAQVRAVLKDTDINRIAKKCGMSRNEGDEQ